MTLDQAIVISFDEMYNLGNFGENFSRMMPLTKHENIHIYRAVDVGDIAAIGQ